MCAIDSQIEDFVESLNVQASTRAVYRRLLRRCAREVGFDDEARLALWFDAAPSPAARRLRRSVVMRFVRGVRGPGPGERLLALIDETIAAAADPVSFRIALSAFVTQTDPWHATSARAWAAKHPLLAEVLLKEWQLVVEAAESVRLGVQLPNLYPQDLPIEVRAAVAALLGFVKASYVPHLRWRCVTEVARDLTLEFQDGSSVDGAILHRPTPALNRALRILRAHFQRVVGRTPAPEDHLAVDLDGDPLDLFAVRACQGLPPSLMARVAVVPTTSPAPQEDDVDWDSMPMNPFD